MAGNTWNIFYTDDDKEDQQMFVDAVNEVTNDVHVTLQSNGDDLIQSLKNPPPTPHIIFLDLNMPVKNGFEVLEEIKQSDTNSNVPVLIFTTSDHLSAIQKTKELGATLYIQKPLTFAALKDVITHVLSINWQTFRSAENDFVYRVN